MLTVTIFAPLLAALGLLALPSTKPAAARRLALVGSLTTLFLTVVLALGYDPSGPALQWRNTVAWIPALGASFDVGVDGLSLAMMLLTALLLTLCMLYVQPFLEGARAHSFLMLSGFIAEFQVLAATVGVSVPAAALTVLGLVITTALYLRVLVKVVMGEGGEERLRLTPRQLWAVAPLVLLALALGLFPQPVVALLEGGTRFVVGFGS